MNDGHHSINKLMRYKPEHKEEIHKRIVETAAREFREKGFDGVGIATLMKKLELTHGGFYAHFEDKNVLVQEALIACFDEADDQIGATYRRLGIAGVIELYLSSGHVANPGFGCPVPALASEIARQPGDLGSLFESRLKRRIETFADDVPGETASDRFDLATFIFCAMAGAVTTARSVREPELRERILDSTKTQLLNLIEDPK